MVLLAHWGAAFFAFGGLAGILLLLAYPIWREEVEVPAVACAAISFAGALVLFVSSHQPTQAEVAEAAPSPEPSVLAMPLVAPPDRPATPKPAVAASEAPAHPEPTPKRPVVAAHAAFSFTAAEFMVTWNLQNEGGQGLTISGLGGYKKAAKAYPLDFSHEDFTRVVERMRASGGLEGDPGDYALNATGELMAEHSGGRISQISVTGNDADPANQAAMQHQAVSLIIFFDPRLLPQEAADLAVTHLRLADRDERPRSLAIGDAVISFARDHGTAKLTARPATHQGARH